MTEHAEPHSFLVTVHQGTEPLRVLVTALVWDMTHENCFPLLLLKLLKVALNELELLVRIRKLVPEHQIMEIAAFSVQ